MWRIPRFSVRGSLIRHAGFAALLCTTLMVCSNSDNPYLDESTAGVHLSLTGAASDSLPIFSTYELEVSIILPAMARDVHLTGSNNRFWNDTSFTAEPSLPNPLRLPVSFIDTGMQTLIAVMVLDKGDTLVSEQQVRCYSPLRQHDLLVHEGDTLNLSTPPVDDAVIYVWDLGNGLPGPSDGPDVTYVVDSQAVGPIGKVYVKAGNARSPAHTFRVTMVDSRPPSITILNNSLVGRRIVAGTDPFMLSVQVRDATGVVSSATVNDESFDQIMPGDDEHTIVCGKWIEGTSSLGYDSLQTVIRALDDAGNVAVDTFWVAYDSTLGQTEIPVIEVLSPEYDGVVVAQPSVTVNGTVRNLAGRDSVLAFIQVNDSVFGDSPRVLRRDGDTWAWTVPLQEGTNSMVVRLVEKVADLGNPLTSSSFSIVYQPGATDEQKPVIASVTSNSVPVGSSLIVSSSPVPLLITAYDIGSGVRDVTVNGVAATLSGDGEYSIEVPVTHTKEGALVTILVTDSSDNVASRDIQLYKNALPQFVTVPGLRHAVVDEPHADTIEVSDPDGDTLSTNVTIRAPSGEQTFGLGDNGTFTWTPSTADTGMVQVDITAWDGYQAVDTSYFIAVRAGSEPTPEVHFVSTEADFPDSLRVGRDTLRVTLRVDQPPDPGTYLYTARVVETNQTLINYSMDSVLVWAPALSDTGTRNLEVVVISADGHGDTLTPVITIVPPVWVTLSSSSSSGLESTASCSVAVELSRIPTEIMEVNFTIGASGSSADSSDWNARTLSPLTFAPGTRMKHIAFDIVDDSRVESDETLVISLVSATSGARIGAVREHSYTILNNDMNITPVDTPSVAFGTAPTSGAETADTITVPVVLSSPAPWTIEVAVVNSGTATAGSDYTYAPHTAVFDSGDSVVNVSVIIIDDTLCETGAETLTLGLVTTGQPVKGGSPSSYSYTIDANDSEYCGRNIYYVRNHGRPYNVDKAAQDSLTAWGYTVTEINDKEIGNYDYSQVAAIFISQSVTSSISALRDKGVPIVCAGSPGHVELGLATASDTGRSLSTSVVVVAAGIPSHPVGDSIQVTNGQRLLPWIRPTSSGTVVAHVADAQGSTPPMHAGVAIFSSGAALAGGGNASAARAMITMAGGGLTLDNQNAYAAGWWEILNSAMEWARRQ